MVEKQKKKKGVRVLFDEKVKCPYCNEEMRISVMEETIKPSTPAEKKKTVITEKL